MVGVEALLRWERPLFGPVPPDVIIPVAEEAGLIDELSRWTLRKACTDARRLDACLARREHIDR